MARNGESASALSQANTVYSLSEEETLRLGRTMAQTLKGGELIVLEGDLGMGKTVFARGIAIGLGISEDEVRSPSFTLVHEYEGGRYPLFHVDLYRLDGDEDLEGLGLDELTEAGGVVLVEWGEKLPLWYRRDALTVRFHDLGEDSRQIELDQRAVPARRRGDA
jgi:tRNA threonylcarbamoyladenosine biosynthesis protein TsaE